MSDVLYRPELVIDAMAAVLDTALPDGVKVEQDTADWTAPQVVLELVAGPTTEGFGIGGPDYATIEVQATCVGQTRPTARFLGSLVRRGLCEVTRGGTPVRAVEVTGAVVDPVVTAGDGHIAQDDPATWVETYRVRYQKA